MPAQRKTFRIEEFIEADEPMEMARDGDVTAAHNELLAEIRALRAFIESRSAPAAAPRPDVQAQEVRKLKIELDVIGGAIKQTRSEIVSLQDQGFDSSRVARVGKELEAVFGDTSAATERILKSAEEIDESANALASMLKGGHELGLAQDIQDRATAIFEACNFHDLTGQRISKVAATLKMVEEHLARMMEIWSVIDRFNFDAAQSAAHNLDGLLNGPKLEGDNGHSSQDDIDKLFH
ncbi:MAG: protein phosphatase CheZ [Pseudorhodoplanes sp.]